MRSSCSAVEKNGKIEASYGIRSLESHSSLFSLTTFMLFHVVSIDPFCAGKV